MITLGYLFKKILKAPNFKFLKECSLMVEYPDFSTLFCFLLLLAVGGMGIQLIVPIWYSYKHVSPYS